MRACPNTRRRHRVLGRGCEYTRILEEGAAGPGRACTRASSIRARVSARPRVQAPVGYTRVLEDGAADPETRNRSLLLDTLQDSAPRYTAGYSYPSVLLLDDTLDTPQDSAAGPGRAPPYEYQHTRIVSFRTVSGL